MGKLVDKAAKRDDVYELVRLTHAFPLERPDVDAALVQVAQRLGAKRKGDELAWILTLPETGGPWLAVDEAIRQLVLLGPQVAPRVWAATVSSHNSARLNGARAMEALGQGEYAEQLRSRARMTDARTVTVPAKKPPEGLGGWLVVPLFVFFFAILSAAGDCLSLLDHTRGSSSIDWTWLFDHYTDRAWARPLFIYELFAHIVLLAAGVTLIVFAFQKRRAFRLFAPWYYPFAALASVLFYAFLPNHHIARMVWIAMVAVGWLLYFLLSKRVKNTFTGPAAPALPQPPVLPPGDWTAAARGGPYVVPGPAPGFAAPPVAGPAWASTAAPGPPPPAAAFPVAPQPMAPSPAASRPAVPWSVRDVWLGIGTAVLVVAASYASIYVMRALSVRPNLDLWIAVSPTVFYLFFAAAAWWFSVHKHGASARSLGFAGFKVSILGIALGLLVLQFIVDAVYSSVLAHYGLRAQTDLSPVLARLSSLWPLIISVVVIGPFVEELFFRGFVFGGLRARYDWRMAAVISAAVFAAFHLELLGFIPLFITGLFLAYLYQRSKSIWPPVIFHMCMNGMAMLAYYAVVHST